MNRRRRRITAAVMAMAGSATVVALLVAPAQAQAPDVTAWWSAANVGNGAPPPPVPPDVAAGDLLVQGSNANGNAPTLPVSGAPATSQAVAGLIFELPDNATVGPLTLKIDGTAPPSVSIVACKATQTFAAADNGAWTEVPPSDCSQTSAAKLSSDGSGLVFDDVSKLVANGRLAITLLPGALDRVVLKKPDDAALTVTAGGGSLGGSSAAFGSGGGGATSGSQPQAAPPPVAAVGGSSVLPAAGTDGAAAVPPVVAPSAAASQPGGGIAPAASTAASGTGGLSTTQRRVLAMFVIGLELLGFMMLLGDRDAERLTLRSAAPALAGGRLRPPDRVRPGTAAAGSVAGIGRFRGERQGRPPRL